MPYLQAHATWGKQPPTTKSELQDVSYVFPQKKSDFFFQQKPDFFSAKGKNRKSNVSTLKIFL